MKFEIKMVTLEIVPGANIRDVCEEVVLLSKDLNAPVFFEFNDSKILIKPGDSIEVVMSKFEYGQAIERMSH